MSSVVESSAPGHGGPADRDRISALLGVPAVELRAALSRLVGHPVNESSLRLGTVAYASGSPGTASLQRVVGTAAAGRRFSIFVKLLRHGRHWPDLARMPPEFAAAFAAEFPWRDELRLWDPRVQASLPTGLRSPELLALVELPDDYVAVWTEDVQQSADGIWDLGRFSKAAFLLGRWNARSTTPEILAISPFPVGHGLRMYAERSVPVRGLAPLRDDDLWQHHWLAQHQELRIRLTRLGARIPEFLDTLDALPQCLPHGDASPQNLLVPRADPSETADLVVIDVSFGTPHAVGFDLGQLLVGLVHAGELPASGMAAIAEVLVPAYVDGAAAEGIDLPFDTVYVGFALSALLRSGLDSFRLDLLDRDLDDEVAAHDFAERLVLASTLADLAVRVT